MVNNIQTHATLVLFILPRMLSGAPLRLEEDNTSNTNNLQTNFIDGIEESDLPKQYKDVAVICDFYRKLTALLAGLESESSREQVNEHHSAVINGDYDPNEYTEAFSQYTTRLSENVNELQKELVTDVHADNENENLKRPDGEQAVRKERVRRNNSNGIPQELLQMLQGVCMTDECLKVVKEYFEWRQQNGYPVYTGVTDLG